MSSPSACEILILLICVPSLLRVPATCSAVPLTTPLTVLACPFGTCCVFPSRYSVKVNSSSKTLFISICTFGCKLPSIFGPPAALLTLLM
eukprot:Awhi_evm2s1694